MLILIFILSFVIGAMIVMSDCGDDDFGFAITFIGCGVSFIVAFMMMLFYPYNIDKKIAMYEEENTKIEEKVKNTVRVYMNYEKDTYKELIEETDLTTLLVAYPDLNSNELVKSEVALYVENNRQIKEFKELQITRSTMRWWLYFGK